MKKAIRKKMITIGVLIISVVAIVEFQKFMQRRTPVCIDGSCAVPAEYAAAKVSGPQTVPFMPPAPPAHEKPLPQLIAFRTEANSLCTMMDIVLNELAVDLSGKLKIRFVDTDKQAEETERMSIQNVPTQLFLDEQDNELFRREGFISKEDLLKQWGKLGYTF